MSDSKFWDQKKVLITGHTGFKGAWLTLWLADKGAHICGVALEPEDDPALFNQFGLQTRIDHRIGDIRSPGLLEELVAEVQPQVVFHMAAQSLVRRSYKDPLSTWGTNVMGSANLLHALMQIDKICAVVSVTTDKVYQNREWVYAYRETDRLGGHDPYSASKAANELLASSWRDALLEGTGVRLATARAGNVIGGGDWAEDRILPDMMRAAANGDTVAIRNPASVRPWQHVLEPLQGYMTLAQQLYLSDQSSLQSAFNFGPNASAQRSVGELVAEVREHWFVDVNQPEQIDAPHEAKLLSLAIEKAQAELNWHPRWTFETAVEQTVHWYREVNSDADPVALAREQIAAYEACL